jgi:hypothetical protein
MSGFDEHASGQFRIGAAGDQMPLLPLPDAGIPALERTPTPAEVEVDRRARAGTDAGLAEDLALERLAVADHERAAGEAWHAGRYAASRLETLEADAARARLEQLERRCTCSAVARILADNDPANGSTAARIVAMTEGRCNGCGGRRDDFA